ncbi:MAG: sulfurtransferase [Chloroflexota bacterium]
MAYQTLISVTELQQNLDNPNWAIIDCRFSLNDIERGRRDYEQSHISGAIYAHLDDDLSGPIIPGKTSRHPLPEVDVFTQTLAKWGIDETVQVVAYDDMGGALAARLWWMLRWMGHEAVAVLDGGWPRWEAEAANQAVVGGVETRSPRTFTPKVRSVLLATVAEVNQRRTDPEFRLLDARGADRYRGENETIDPIAGHIPGAQSAPFAENLAEGRFRSIEALQARFKPILGDISAENTIIYCGSGVTAAHNILAIHHAGLGEARLYPGSWSGWITDASRPVATGDE